MAKFNIEDLKKEYSAEGWVLLADKYENLSPTRWYSFLSNRDCLGN
jgi:hypothetical protein